MQPVISRPTLKNNKSTTRSSTKYKLQKQPPRSVSRKRCSENMQQIYRRTFMPKCDFNKIEITLLSDLKLL